MGFCELFPLESDCSWCPCQQVHSCEAAVVSKEHFSFISKCPGSSMPLLSHASLQTHVHIYILQWFFLFSTWRSLWFLLLHFLTFTVNNENYKEGKSQHDMVCMGIIFKWRDYLICRNVYILVQCVLVYDVTFLSDISFMFIVSTYWSKGSSCWIYLVLLFGKLFNLNKRDKNWAGEEEASICWWTPEMPTIIWCCTKLKQGAGNSFQVCPVCSTKPVTWAFNITSPALH